MRGLNTNSTGPGANGGTVATYLGELPLFLNMRLTDIQRVEVLEAKSAPDIKPLTAEIAINKAEIAVLKAKVDEIKARSDNPLQQ